jgi:hypothetical protein
MRFSLCFTIEEAEIFEVEVALIAMRPRDRGPPVAASPRIGTASTTRTSGKDVLGQDECGQAEARNDKAGHPIRLIQAVRQEYREEQAKEDDRSDEATMQPRIPVDAWPTHPA